MNPQEKKWFKPYTWNGEVETIAVLIEPVDSTVCKAIKTTTEDYLKLLGFREVEHICKPIAGWSLNFVDKLFMPLNNWELSMYKRTVKTIWPSQISLFLNEKRGAITSHKFGI